MCLTADSSKSITFHNALKSFTFRNSGNINPSISIFENV